MSCELLVLVSAAVAVERASKDPWWCGSAWNRHITYIMMDFLSGAAVWTSGGLIYALLLLYGSHKLRHKAVFNPMLGRTNSIINPITPIVSSGGTHK